MMKLSFTSSNMQFGHNHTSHSRAEPRGQLPPLAPPKTLLLVLFNNLITKHHNQVQIFKKKKKKKSNEMYKACNYI